MSNKKQIFLSHKDSDAPVAEEVAKGLESVLPGAVSVWRFKKKLPSGKVWRQEISYQIGRADWFVLLILDPLAELDWCLYEAGQFIGKWEEEEQHGQDQQKGQKRAKYRLQRRLTCLSGIDQSRIPSQLSDLQHVYARTSNTTPVEEFLRQIVLGEDVEERSDLFCQYWNAKSDSHIKEVANGLCTSIEKATIARTDYCRYLDIEVPLSEALSAASAAVPVTGDAQSDDVFSRALVSGEGLAELLGSDHIPNWKAFGDRVGQNHYPAKWVNELREWIRDPKTSDYPAYTPFTNETNKWIYQPLLYRVQKRNAGESVYRIHFYRTKADYVPVSTFQELMDRLVEQLKRRKEATCFMAYTPALGFLALAESEWNKVQEAMIDNAENIRLICPLEPDIKRFHQRFMGRKTKRADKIEQDLIDSANQAAEQLINEVESVGGEVKRLAWRKLPHYYLFVGKSWGIITVTFFVPDPNQKKGGAQPMRKRSDIPNVEMFGLLTTEETTIDQQFLKVFNQYW